MLADAYTAQRPFERLVFALDERLRRRHAVFEYSDNPDCILRIQLDDAERRYLLSDGTRLAPGDPLINIHLWNEHFPRMGEHASNIGWARQVARSMDLSLRELAAYLATHRAFDSIVAIRSVMRLARADHGQQLQRISAHYGFEPIAPMTTPTLGERLHHVGENLLGLLFVLARNPTAARFDVLLRDGAQVFLSRRALDRRYRDALPQQFRTGADES